jgi:hypothetical protein
MFGNGWPLALTVLLALGGVSLVQNPGSPRASDPFGTRQNSQWPGFPENRSAQRKKDEDDLRRLRMAGEAGRHAAGHLVDGRHNSPRFEPPSKWSAPTSTPSVKPTGSWLSRAGSSARSWPCGITADVAAGLAAIFHPRT